MGTKAKYEWWQYCPTCKSNGTESPTVRNGTLSTGDSTERLYCICPVCATTYFVDAQRRMILTTPAQLAKISKMESRNKR